MLNIYLIDNNLLQFFETFEKFFWNNTILEQIILPIYKSA